MNDLMDVRLEALSDEMFLATVDTDSDDDDEYKILSGSEPGYRSESETEDLESLFQEDRTNDNEDEAGPINHLRRALSGMTVEEDILVSRNYLINTHPLLWFQPDPNDHTVVSAGEESEDELENTDNDYNYGPFQADSQTAAPFHSQEEDDGIFSDNADDDDEYFPDTDNNDNETEENVSIPKLSLNPTTNNAIVAASSIGLQYQYLFIINKLS
jgi:hypothetical protein